MMQRRKVIQAIFSLALAQGVHSTGAMARVDAVELIAGEPEWLPLAKSLSEELDHRQGLRLLPGLGHGSLQALGDLYNLPSVDAALVSADCLAYADAQGLLAPTRDRFAYVTRLQSLPVMLIAHNSIASLTALANRRLCTGSALSASFATGELIFGALGVPFVRVAKSGTLALQALRNGEADGALLLGTEALQAGGTLRDFHILPLPLPQGLETVYEVHRLDKVDLPGLPANSPALETISTSLVLAAATAKRSGAPDPALKQLITELFSGALQLPWLTKGTLTADVTGWQRHPMAIEASNAFLAK